MPKHNTDNKVHLFVTLFALAFRHLDNFVKQDKPGLRTYFRSNFVYLDSIPVRLYVCNATLVYARQFVPGRQKVRHGLFIMVVFENTALKKLLWSQPPFTNQHKRTLLPGRYKQCKVAVTRFV